MNPFFYMLIKFSLLSMQGDFVPYTVTALIFLEPKTAPAPHLPPLFRPTGLPRRLYQVLSSRAYDNGSILPGISFCTCSVSIPRDARLLLHGHFHQDLNIGRSLRLPSQNNSIIPGLFEHHSKIPAAVGGCDASGHHILERHIEPAGRRRSRSIRRSCIDNNHSLF